MQAGRDARRFKIGSEIRRANPSPKTRPCLTSREPVPHFQPVVLAVPLPARQGVVLQVKGEEGQGHVHAGGDDDDEGALQVVGVLVGEARGLDEAGGTGEVTGAVRACDADTEGILQPL